MRPMNSPQRALKCRVPLQHQPSPRLPKWAMKACILSAPGQLWESSILVQLTDLTSRTSKSPICLICHSVSTPPLRLLSPPKSGKCFATLCSRSPFILHHSLFRCFGISAGVRCALILGRLHAQGWHSVDPHDASTSVHWDVCRLCLQLSHPCLAGC